MLVMLLPEQVARNWDEIKGMLIEVVPGPNGHSPERMNNILEDLLLGKKKLWVSYTHDTQKFEGVVGTEIFFDRINGLRTMEIFALWGMGVSRRSWESGRQTLWRYANKEECKRVVAYTMNKSVLDYLKELGADVSAFCEVELKPFANNLQ